MIKNFNSEYFKSEKNLDEEIDIRIIFSLINRNKILISSIAFLSFVIACLFSLTLKKVWEGQFQIVLNSDNQPQVLNSNLRNFIASGNNNNLKTQVGILQSPSVLMPIYDLVNGKNNKDLNTQLPFPIWKKNLNVELQRDTSILNIAYRDTNKAIILPALKKMSSIYQDYSSKGEKRNQDLTKTYLLNQIKLFREKSSNSLKTAQNFAIDQDLIYISELNSQSLSSNNVQEELSSFLPEFLGSNINIENIRVNAANEIRVINLQIKKINGLDSKDFENLQYFGSSIPALTEEGLPQTLKNIEQQLVFLRTQYTNEDKSITRLLEQRDLIINLLKSRAIKYLKVAKLEAESRMEAAKRPKGVLLKYKELLRDAARDEATLVSLENDLRSLELEQARFSDPWELITKPTLLKNAVAPSRRTIGFVGLIIGAFIGILASFYKEKSKGTINDIYSFERILSVPLLDEIYLDNDFPRQKELFFIKDFIKKQSEKNVTFLFTEEINLNFLKKLKEFLNKDCNVDKSINLVNSEKSFEQITQSETILLFTSLNSAKYIAIKSLVNKLRFLNYNLKGFVLLKSN